MTTGHRSSVAILGSSLAGLAAAYDLCGRGHSVTVLEHPAWDPDLPAGRLDAGLFLHGSEQETLRLFDRLHAGQAQGRHRRIPLEFQLPDGRFAAYQPARLPGALHWIAGLLRFTALSWPDRWRLFSYLEQLWEEIQRLPADLDSRLADDWLAAIGQSRAARETVWNPLTLRLTGNRVDQVSAGVFVEVMSRTFLRRAPDAALMSVSGTLRTSSLLTSLRQAVGPTLNRCRGAIPLMTFEQDRATGVRLGDGTVVQADWYIIALQPHHCRSLLPEGLLTRWAYFAHLADLTPLPEIAVHIRCRADPGRPRLVLRGQSPLHEMALMPYDGEVMECRLTGLSHQSIAAMDDRELADYGLRELHTLLPELGPDDVQRIEVSRNPSGALSLHPGASRLRPVQKSPIRNVMLAGAWTDTGWPAGPESAVISAHRCAAIIADAAV